MNAEEHYLKRELYELIQQDHSAFEFLQQGSLDGIWYWDLENPDAEWMSPRFWELLGYDYREMKPLASEWQDLVHPDDLQIALSNLTKHCEDPSHQYDQIVRYRHKDGSTVWVRCRGIATRNKLGKPVRMLGAHTDLTQLKQTEEALRQRTIELEELNAQLQIALNDVKTLTGLLPICSYCNKIRDDEGYWHRIEAYIENRTDAKFSHGICPECLPKVRAEAGLVSVD